jgi:transposase
MVPLVHDPGVEAEVDWGEAVVVLRGARTKVFIFHMRACHSGGSFVVAFPRETQQAFLEAHAAAFDWFGGVFQTVRYDNLKAAVTKILKGRRRVESDRFVALRSHYLFASSFCEPGEQGAMKRAASRARWAAFAAGISSRCPRCRASLS